MFAHIAAVTITAVAVLGVVKCLPCKLTVSLGVGRARASTAGRPPSTIRS